MDFRPVSAVMPALSRSAIKPAMAASVSAPGLVGEIAGQESGRRQAGQNDVARSCRQRALGKEAAHGQFQQGRRLFDRALMLGFQILEQLGAARHIAGQPVHLGRQFPPAAHRRKLARRTRACNCVSRCSRCSSGIFGFWKKLSKLAEFNTGVIKPANCRLFSMPMIFSSTNNSRSIFSSGAQS